MMKRTLALILCFVMCLSAVATFASCAKKDEDYKGEYITMYLPTNIYDLDPVNAYYNESSRQIVSLLFETLFVLDDNGKVQKGLAEDYKIIENKKTGERKMEITLAESFWSDNTAITANDVVFAWKRVLDAEASYEAASLLYDIRNARKAKEGEASIDDVGLYADNKIVTIEFEGEIDYDQFLINLTSLALAPINEAYAKGEDWAKKPSTMVCSGPFKLSRIQFIQDESVKYTDTDYDIANKSAEDGYIHYENVNKDFNSTVISSFIIERNSYYFRNIVDDKTDIDSKVTPYRILVDCSLNAEQIQAAYDAGQILYIGDIPLSLRSTYSTEEYKKELTLKDSLSTHTYYLNQNALIKKRGSEVGEALFANKAVRQALSKAIDRDAIAEMVVFADAATGIVPSGVFASGTRKDTFREVCKNQYANLTKNMDEARSLLTNAGITASDYSFSITVAAYDEVHLAIAEQVKNAWCELGFNVEIKERGVIVNNDYSKNIEEVPEDFGDDLYMKDLKSGTYEVIALDEVASVATPYAVLSPYAKAFSGQGMDMTNTSYELAPHLTGYDSEDYNSLMEKIYEEKNIKNRNDNLIKAEEILMEDMPSIPVIFNKYGTLKKKNLDLNDKTLWWSKNTNYASTTNFEKMEVKKYDEYLTVCADFLSEHFEEYKANDFSYFHSYNEFTFEEFKSESSNYSYLFPRQDD